MKNRLPHKSLLDFKTRAEILLNRDPVKARSNLRTLRQKVLCFDYEIRASDEIKPSGWKGRIVDYTSSFRVYAVISPEGRFKIVKNPTLIESDTPSGSESENEQSTISSKPFQNPITVIILQPDPPTAFRKK